MEEQSELRNCPKINKDYPIDEENWIPIHERLPKPKDYDNILLKRRQGNPQKDENEDSECTFKPNFVSNNRNKSRSVDDLLKWGDDKLFKIANMRLGKLKGTEHTYQPNIDKNSKKMAGKRKGAVEDRLLEAGKNVSAKNDKKRESYQKKMFRPRINLNSKRILNKMNDELFKKDNGQTENLDFYEAVPIPTWNTRLTLGKSKTERGTPDKPIFDSRSRFQSKDLKEAKEQEKLDRRLRMKQSMRKSRKSRRKGSKEGKEGSLTDSKKKAVMDSKTVEFLDDYISPYNKRMLASGLPLKTILKKSKKANKLGKRGKNKQRGLSQRRKSMSDLSGAKKWGGKSRSSRSKSNSNLLNSRNSRSKRNLKKSKNKSKGGKSKSSKSKTKRKYRSHSHSEKSFKPYCQNFDPKEFARERRERLFDHKQWNDEIRRRNEERSLSNVKRLIYSDLYDAKSQKRPRNYSIDNSDFDRRGSFKSKSAGKRKAPLNFYHPVNQDKKHRMRNDVGNNYMYQSIEENKGEDEVRGRYDVDYGVRNVFNHIALH